MASDTILWRPAPPADHRLHYGQRPPQFGDLRLPQGSGPFPIVIAIHGGYWRSRYTLDYLGHACAALTAAGFATWNIEYHRLSWRSGGWPTTFLDVGAATDHLRTLAQQYPLDLARVATLGHSAGGQLALWAAARHRLPTTSPLSPTTPPPLPIHAAIALAGVVDLHLAWEQHLSDNVVRDLLGGSPAQYPERYAATSPITLLPLGLPQTLIHGQRDDNVPFALSRDYVAAAQRQGDPATLIALPDAGHFEPVDPTTPEWRHVQETVAHHLPT